MGNHPVCRIYFEMQGLQEIPTTNERKQNWFLNCGQRGIVKLKRHWHNLCSCNCEFRRDGRYQITWRQPKFRKFKGDLILFLKELPFPWDSELGSSPYFRKLHPGTTGSPTGREFGLSDNCAEYFHSRE